MSRVILHVTVATITFIIGVTSNWSINTFGGLAVDNVYSEPALDVNTSTVLPDPASDRSLSSCGRLVVTVTADGALNLNTTPTGTLNDTRALTAKLRRVFAEREEWHAYVPGPALSSRVPEYRQIVRAVYIRAPRGVSYGEVADLIAVIKEAGADPVGLIDSSNPQP